MKNGNRLTEAQLRLIREQMHPGEGLCWVGCEARRRFVRERLLRIGFYSLWTILAGLLGAWMLWMNPQFLQRSLRHMLPVLVPLMLAAGGGFLLVREILFPSHGQPDLYAITTERAVLISSGRHPVVHSYDPQAVSSALIKRRRDGSGDILFERRSRWRFDADGRLTRQIGAVGFYGLACVEATARLLRQVGQQKAVTVRQLEEI